MSKSIKIIPLGGVREEGKNLYVVEVNEAIFVLDCGLVYPEGELLGIDAVIPDFTYLEENKDRVEGIFLSHGHDDAIGALPYLLEVVPAPVFGTELTIELAKLACKKQPTKHKFDDFYVIDGDTEIEFDEATVSFFKTTHTIPDSVGIVVHTNEGAVVYTGDFKFDPSAQGSYKTDYKRLTELGSKGVLALMADSSNVEHPMLNLTDQKIVEELKETFLNAPGRVIVASIGSNIARISQVLAAAAASNRKVFISGDQLYDIVDIAIKLNKIEIQSRDDIGNMRQLDKTPDDEVVVLETGDVGEPIKALQAMAEDRHREITLKEGDLVYLATTPSTAMETTLAKTKDMIYRAGASVGSITDNFRVSGHATQADLQLLMDLLNPKYIIPVTGESRMLFAHGKLAQELGYKEDEIFYPKLGDVVEYAKGTMGITSTVPSGDTLIDGIGVGDIGNVVLRDRRILSEDGIFVVVATISRRLKRVLVGPQITSRGFVYMKTSIDLIQECSDMTLDVLDEHLASDNFDWSDLKNDLREKLGKYLFKETKRRPVILPIIMEASSYQPDND
ncbi:ribonuclease J [Aerococcaceae bacterium DSM 111022]|nr:ribonuclease J [Aerococcaceae bacterium DSM 111022]